MIENVVLGIELGKGNYFISGNSELGIRVFLAYNPIGVGTQRMIHYLSNAHIPEEFQRYEQIFEGRDEVILALKRAAKIRSRRNIKYALDETRGGEYEFVDGVLKLCKKMKFHQFESPNLADLQDIRSNLTGYKCKDKTKVREVIFS